MNLKKLMLLILIIVLAIGVPVVLSETATTLHSSDSRGENSSDASSAYSMANESMDDLPSLKELYADRFDVGICVPRGLIGQNEQMELIQYQFNIVTPENELKPASVIDVAASALLAEEDETAVSVHFDAAEPLLEYAKGRGLKVHGHVLVWHKQTPEAFFHEHYDVSAPLASREIMLGRMDNYISQVFSFLNKNYPGMIVSCDVVNEAIDDDSGELRDSPWLETVGRDYVARAFEIARKYAPAETMLYYNDCDTALMVKQDGIVKLLVELMSEGNIDGYGFQMHHDLWSPSMEEISSAVTRISALGLRLRVSEMDIGVDDDSEASFTSQAQMYKEIMQLLNKHADQFEAVQFWGLSDNVSWRASEYPLLFDDQLRAKPSFWAVANAGNNRNVSEDKQGWFWFL